MQNTGVNEKEQERTEPKPAQPAVQPKLPTEIGGVKGPEPTRYGDWERKGVAVDF